MRTGVFVWAFCFVVGGCNAGPKQATVTTAPAGEVKRAPVASALRLGAAIEESVTTVALAEVAKAPATFVGRTFATTGTVTAVCQHMGCWMELKDDTREGFEAHVKMAGHAFFVPKTASGRKARVLATLAPQREEAACADEHHGKMGAAATGGSAAGEAKGQEGSKKGCRAEAETQLGRPLAKLELVAQGVELM